MFNQLKTICRQTVAFNEEDLQLIDKYFSELILQKKEFLLENGTTCNFLGFVASGSIRHFHIKDGVEKTCDISFENSWVTDFQSFTNASPCIMNLQAMEKTTIYAIQKKDLEKLYKECNKYESFARIMTEQILTRATEIAMSLSSDKPEERYLKLIQKQPGIFQRIPQKHIANFLGITPESLSRIRRRIYNGPKS